MREQLRTVKGETYVRHDVWLLLRRAGVSVVNEGEVADCTVERVSEVQMKVFKLHTRVDTVGLVVESQQVYLTVHVFCSASRKPRPA